MGWFKDITKDSLSGVLVTAVTGSGIVYWLWDYFKKLFQWVLACLSYPVTMPVWALIILSFFLLISLPTLTFLIRRNMASKSNESAGDLLSYNRDIIYEMVVTWRWKKFIGNSGYSLDALEMRCPHCGGLLSEYSNMDRLHYDPYPIIKCRFEGCNWKVANNLKNTTFGDMRHKIKQEIDRRCFQKFGS